MELDLGSDPKCGTADVTNVFFCESVHVDVQMRALMRGSERCTVDQRHGYDDISFGMLDQLICQRWTSTQSLISSDCWLGFQYISNLFFSVLFSSSILLSFLLNSHLSDSVREVPAEPYRRIISGLN